jgi:serine/threonine protein kinase
MAEIFLSRKASLGQVSKFVVLKKISKAYQGKTTFEQLFVQEARITALLSHPNTVQLHELAEIDGAYCMSMEYIHGISSAEMMSRAVQVRKSVPLEVSLGIVANMAYALDYCAQPINHEGELLGILHNDVSPHNIQVRFDGEVKLLDFGVATQVHLTQSGGRRGKYAYMSPEAFLRQELDHRSDQFALGVVLFELLLGRRLFKGKTSEETKQKAQECEIPRPRAINPAIPKSIEEILLKSLAKDRDERFENHLAFAIAIEEAAKGLEIDISRRAIAKYLQNIYGDEIKSRQESLKALSEKCALLEAQIENNETIDSDIQVVEIQDEMAKLHDQAIPSSIPNPPTIPQQILGLMKSNTPIANPQPQIDTQAVDTQPNLPIVSDVLIEKSAPAPVELLSAQPTMTKLFTSENDEAAENLDTLQAQPIVLPDSSHLKSAIIEQIKPLATHDQDWDDVNKSQVNSLNSQKQLQDAAQSDMASLEISSAQRAQKKSSALSFILIALLAAIFGIALGLFTDVKHYLKFVQVPKQQLNLEIQTQPQGAHVIIQGIDQGKTPFKQSIEMGGKKLDIQLRLNDYMTYEKLLDVNPLQETFHLDVQMQKKQEP